MTLLRALLIVLALLVAAQFRRPAAPVPASATDPDEAPAQVKAWLLTDLQRQVHESGHWHPVLERSTRFESRRSRVVPGLVYHWASHPVPMSHAPDTHALVGTRGGLNFLVAQRAWPAMAAGWTPAGRAEALEGCLEYVRVSWGEGPDGGSVSAEGDREWYRSMLESQPADFSRRVSQPARVTGPTAAAKAWRVEFWTIDPGTAALRYRCVLPVPGSAAGPELIVADSVPLPYQVGRL